MVLGLATGLFFGESCKHLEIIGQSYIALLRVSVLPYIFFSLMSSFGSLSYAEAKMLSWRGGLIVILMWLCTFSVISIIPQLLPNWKSATFFSSSLINPPEGINYIDIFIPSNPFFSLANNIVPAVTVFSILMGVALIGNANKKVLLNVLDVTCETLSNITKMMVKLTPLGVFAIIANVAGTMRAEDVGRLEVYFFSFWAAALVLGLVIFPFLVMIFTPFKYFEIFRVTRTALLTVFLTNNLFIVLPLLTANLNEMFKNHHMDSEERESLSRIIVPVAYIVPVSGQLLDIIFIHFSSWFNGSYLGILQYIELYSLGLLALFGSAKVAVQFMLQSFGLPRNLYEIYLASTPINDNLRMTIEAIAIFCLALLCICWMTGKLRLNLRRGLVLTGIMIAISVTILLGTKIVMNATFSSDFSNAKTLAAMEIKWAVEHEYHPALPPEPPKADQESNRLAAIRSRGILRVGVHLNVIPFTFINTKGELVGFDVEMANQLAKSLGCRKIEFYQVDYNALADVLNQGYVDIVMAAVSISDGRLGKIAFTDHYMELNMAIMVQENLADELTEDIAYIDQARFRIAMIDGGAYHEKAEKLIRKAKIVPLRNIDDFFTESKADALVFTAEEAYAWRIINPGYAVVLFPERFNRKDLIAYAIANGEQDFINYLNNWLEMKKANGNIQRNYDYWVLGQDVIAPESRWCIMKNVLGW